MDLCSPAEDFILYGELDYSNYRSQNDSHIY